MIMTHAMQCQLGLVPQSTARHHLTDDMMLRLLTVVMKHPAEEAIAIQQATEQSMQQVCWSPC